MFVVTRNPLRKVNIDLMLTQKDNVFISFYLQRLLTDSVFTFTFFVFALVATDCLGETDSRQTKGQTDR